MQEFIKTALQTMAVLSAFSALIQIVTAAVSHDQTMLIPALLTGLVAYGLWYWASARKRDIKATSRAAPIIQTFVTVEEIDTEEPLDAPGWDAQRSFVPSDPKPIQARLRLSYQDAGGLLSERIVDVRECDTRNPEGCLIGHCHLRNAIRTFRLDRIRRAVDLETGEIIPEMTAYAAQKYAESPTASMDKLLGDAADSLRALFYIGKADGRFTAKEKKIFLDFCQAAAGDARITQRHIDDLCAQMDIPTQQSFKLICGRIAKSGHDQGQQVLRAAEAMIATEKTISGNEAEALDYLRRRLAPAG